MANLILKLLHRIMMWMNSNKRLAAEAFLSLLCALSIWYGITVHNLNKALSESLETANTNIEAYLEIATNSQLASTVLKMDLSNLSSSKDKLILELDSIRDKNNIKSSSLTSAATQTQSIVVKDSKGVKGDLLTILKDTTYTDSILYNDLTKVYYTIGRDTVNIGIDLKNTQYIYTYKTRQYKNKKSFLKRLFTFDFKKVDVYKYKIVNSNDLLKESDIRVIEQE